MNDFVKAVNLSEFSQTQCQEIITTTHSCIVKWFKYEVLVDVTGAGNADSKCLMSVAGERVLGVGSTLDWLSLSLGTDVSELNLSATLQNKAATVFLKELLQAFKRSDGLINSVQLKDVSNTVPEQYQLNLSVKAAGRGFVITFYPAFFLNSMPAGLGSGLAGSWRDVLAAEHVSLDVTAGKVRLTLAELAGIAEGDVLPLGQGVKNEFEIYIKESLIATARLAKQSGQRVAVIQADGERVNEKY